ncbi:MAG: hypothetical protein CMP23_17190 [Rickettsiales bacterium]|nr:hypothetical protein [Rickettsiales bacterium]
MSAEDALILGVAVIIVINRLYAHTGLRGIRQAYAAVQVMNLAACLVLFFARLDGLDARLDAGVRLFLIAFVTWHIARNYVAHARRTQARQAVAREAQAGGDSEAEAPPREPPLS